MLHDGGRPAGAEQTLGPDVFSRPVTSLKLASGRVPVLEHERPAVERVQSRALGLSDLLRTVGEFPVGVVQGPAGGVDSPSGGCTLDAEQAGDAACVVEALVEATDDGTGQTTAPPRERIPRHSGATATDGSGQQQLARLHTREVAGSKPAAPIA